MRTEARPLIMHLRAANFVGGPEKQILEHMARLRGGPFRTALCTFDESGRPSSLHEAAKDMGLACHRLPSRSPADPRSVLELAGLLRRTGAALLVTHGYRPNIVGRLACWKAGIPTVAVSRGWTHETAKIRLFETLDRLFLRFADKVVAVSGGQRDKILAAGVAAGSVSVIRNAIDLSGYPCPDGMPAERERLGVPADAPFFGTAGRLSPEKNHMDFIRAAAIVAGKLPAARFVVWGEGFLRPRLERAVSDLGLGGRFHLPGFNRDARRAFHELDVFVLPSLTEGLSNVLLEAFACAKPAVATAVGGNPEVVEDGVSGILVPPGDPEALAGAMLRLAVEPRTRAAMGRAGAMSVRANFDFDGQTRRYVALYLGLVGSGRAAA